MHASHKLPRRTKTLGAVAALCCLTVMLFSVAPALALQGYEPGTPASFGEPGEGAGHLEAPEGVAVNDEKGLVYVADTGNDRIDEFEADGVFVRAWGWGVAGGAAFEVCTSSCRKGLSGSASGEFVSPAFIAVDNSGDASNGDLYVGDSGNDTVTKFSEVGALVGSWGAAGQLKETTGGALFTTLRGVAIDHAGNLWVYDENVTAEHPDVDEFTETGTFEAAGSFNTEKGTEPAFAVESSSAVYLVPGAENVRRFDSGVEQSEFSGEARALSINPSNGDIVVDQGHDVQLYAPGSSPTDIPSLQQTFAAGGLSESHGIAASASALYATQRVADTVEVYNFGGLKPVVEGESVSGVGSSSATLHGQVLPQGEPTSYFFEYGTTTAYGSRTPVESAGAGTGVVSVSASVAGLLADTTYHFRLVASSTNGTAHGGEGSFSTFPVGLLGLPDGRGYELVSSLDNGDATVTGGVRAAADGGAVSYLGQSPLVGGSGNNGNENGRGLGAGNGDNQYLASRSGSGWSASDIQPAGLESARYEAFSSDLAVGVLSSTEPVIEGAPDGEALYSHDDGDGSFHLLGSGMKYAGSTPDGSHLLVSNGAGGLYESAGAELVPVDVLPEGGSPEHAVFGAPERHGAARSGGGPPLGISPAVGGPDFSNAISSDGARVFWTETDAEGHPLRLFVSEGVGTPGERTLQLDASHVLGKDGGGGRFSTASADGTRVFFTDCAQLTADSTAVPTTDCEREEPESPTQTTPVDTPAGNDLYEYDLASGTLTDLTVAPGGEHANVVGVLGASGDGSYVYFAAAGAIASGAQPQECTQPGQSDPGTVCNIYLVHDGGSPQFVAAVTSLEWADWATFVGEHSAYVAPEGGQLVFDSTLNLTSFNSGGTDEIYIYTSDSGIACVSCNPSGTAATTVSGTVAGASLPESSNSTFALRDISANGNRVFFNTKEGLVPQDTNGQQDVYEWEAPGEGGCVTGDSAYSATNGGCLYVLSAGISTDNSTFVDASESGEDVFIMTRADLVPQDHGELREIYDVRVGATPPPPETACTGAGCQGIPGAPPIFATPASATIAGTDDLEPPAPVKKTTKKTVKCAKGKKLTHGKCTKPKPKAKRKAKPKAGKSSASSARRHGSLWGNPPPGAKLSTAGNYAAGAVQG